MWRRKNKFVDAFLQYNSSASVCAGVSSLLTHEVLFGRWQNDPSELMSLQQKHLRDENRRCVRTGGEAVVTDGS